MPIVIVTDPLKRAAEYCRLIAEGKWDEVKPETLKALLRRLSNDAKLNLDRPVETPRTLSGKQANEALRQLCAALSGPTGKPRDKDKWERELGEEFSGTLAASYRVDRAPTKSLEEFEAWLAMEAIRAKAEAHRRTKADKRRDDTTLTVFHERLFPRLRWWKSEEGDFREKMLVNLYRTAAKTLGIAGALTERAVRNSLGLTDSARRRAARMRHLERLGGIRFGEPISNDALIAKGLRLLGHSKSSV